MRAAPSIHNRRRDNSARVQSRAAAAHTIAPEFELLEQRTLFSVIYVDANAPGPTHDGTTWTTAYVRVQNAISNSASGDEIHVADGTYKPTNGTNINATFQLKSGETMFGGYAGFGASDPDQRDIAANPTILSGDIGAVGDPNDNSDHVVTISGTSTSTILDGFTITGSGDGDGAAMFNDGGNATVRNCTFTNNRAGGPGAGAYNTDGAAPTFSNCTFSHNTASGEGGGMANNNASPFIDNCTFVDNTAGSWGSGIADRNSIVTITNSRFLLNGTSFSAGGAIWDVDSSTLVTNCVFVRNKTFNQGGAIASESSQLNVFDSTFFQNGFGSGTGYVAKQGGAIFADGSTVNVSNSILWNNFASQSAPEIGKTNGSTVKVTYTDYQGGHAGAGNINSRPYFMRGTSPGPDGLWGTADDDFGDQRLRLRSPCIDAGSNALVPLGTATDIRGKQRIVDVPGIHDPGAIVDMGAYERQVSTATNPPPGIVTGSASVNGVFGSDDLDDSTADSLLDVILE